jgi:DUF4097 and DUF4098 domain-containing protein YvlB
MPVFDTPGSVSLHIRLPGGRVAVTTADEPRTSVELIPSGRRGSDAVENVRVTAEERAGGHVIKIEEKDRFRWGPLRITWGPEVLVKVTCPPGSNLDLDGGSTDLRVEGDLGEVTVRTASGDVKLGVVRKKLQVKTASGDVSVGSIVEDGNVVTVSGDIGVDRLDGSLNARAVSGDVRIATIRGPLTLVTTSGDARLESIESGELRFQSVSGDARIGVARGTRVWIDATSVSGDLRSELGLADDVPGEDRPESGGDESPNESQIVPLQIKTVSGDVSIVRAAAVFSA